MTLEQAKNELWQVEDELLAMVPESAITKRWPRQETSKVLFGCDRPGSYYWPGSAQLEIRPNTDTRAIFHAIDDAWASRTGWTTSWRSDGADGDYRLDLRRTDGLFFSVMNLEGNTSLQFSSFSPCFELTDYDPNSSY